MEMENLQKENEPKVVLKVRTVMMSHSTIMHSYVARRKDAVLWVKPKISEL